nr:damaged DNA binding 2 [Tanacetum cinerariifolium]
MMLLSHREGLSHYQAEKEPANFALMAFSSSSFSSDNETNEKTGLGYNSQVFTCVTFDCDDYLSLESDFESCPPSSPYDRFQPSDGYHVVPSPYTGTFMPPKPDLPTTPIIEDWVSDSDDESETTAPQIVLSFVQSSEQVKSPRHSVQPVETSIPAATLKMILGTDLHQFDVHNDGYFAHLLLNYVDGVILEIAIPRMLYEQLAEFLEEKCGCYFQGPPKKRYCNEFFVDEMVDWAEMEVKTKGVEAKTSTTEGVKAKNSTIEGVEPRNSTTEGVEDRTRTKDMEKKSDYQSDKSVDYLSPGEDELSKLRNRMKANRNKKAKAKDKPDSRMNEPNEKNSMPKDNVRGKTFEKHDIYMNERLKSLKTTDKDGITKDPFIPIGKHVEREERVVAKCGQRPPMVSTPENDKQRKRDQYALTEYEKSVGEHYSMLRSYGKSILDSNPGSIVKLGMTMNPDVKTYFDRDGNNHIYPMVWAVVNVENKDNWTWILELLEEDLG